jgi:hypothetical protein
MEDRGRWAFRRSRHTASAHSDGFDSLIVTHPFHPLTGQRVSILLERTYRDPTRGRVYVCEAGPLGTVTQEPRPRAQRHALTRFCSIGKAATDARRAVFHDCMPRCEDVAAHDPSFLF